MTRIIWTIEKIHELALLYLNNIETNNFLKMKILNSRKIICN